MDNLGKPWIKQRRRKADPQPPCWKAWAGHQRAADMAESDGCYNKPTQQGGKRGKKKKRRDGFGFVFCCKVVPQTENKLLCQVCLCFLPPLISAAVGAPWISVMVSLIIKLRSVSDNVRGCLGTACSFSHSIFCWVSVGSFETPFSGTNFLLSPHSCFGAPGSDAINYPWLSGSFGALKATFRIWRHTGNRSAGLPRGS